MTAPDGGAIPTPMTSDSASVALRRPLHPGRVCGDARGVRVRVVLALVAAKLVMIVHMAFLAYLVIGGFLALRRFALLWPAIMATAYSIWVTLADRDCPLTVLEKWLVNLGGGTPYEGSFISYYLHDVLYPAQYETVAWLVATSIALFSYVLVLLRRRAAQRSSVAMAGTLRRPPAPRPGIIQSVDLDVPSVTRVGL